MNRISSRFRSKKATDAYLIALAERQAAERRAVSATTPGAAPDPEANPLRRAKNPGTPVEYTLSRPPVRGLSRSASAITVLGIDPGSQCTGWGLVHEFSGVLTLVECGAIRPTGATFSERLACLFTELSTLVARLRPMEVAVEDVHMARNAVSALKLGQARGVAVAACAAHQIPVFDRRPTEVKKSITGAGRADKEQVAYMVARLLNAEISAPADTTDALAVAICHLTLRKFPF